MTDKYMEIIETYKSEGLLEVLHALQGAEGYVSSEAIEILARESGSTPAKIYDTASFYSMFRFTQPSGVVIQICRSAPCHVAGSAEVIEALEDELGICMGESTPDGRFKLEYVECLGQCQDSPCLMVNNILHSQVDAGIARELVKKGGKA